MFSVPFATILSMGLSLETRFILYEQQVLAGWTWRKSAFWGLVSLETLTGANRARVILYSMT